jgi:hypothetical protein
MSRQTGWSRAMTEHHFQLGANRRNRKKEKIAIRGITHIFFKTTSSADDSLRKTVGIHLLQVRQHSRTEPFAVADFSLIQLSEKGKRLYQISLRLL